MRKAVVSKQSRRRTGTFLLVAAISMGAASVRYEPCRRFSGAAAMVPGRHIGWVPAAAAVAADRLALLVRQRFHLAVEVGLALKADAGQIRQCHVAVDNFDPVGEATERLKQVGIGLVAPKPKARGDVQRHLVATVRNAAAWGPTMLLEH